LAGLFPGGAAEDLAELTLFFGFYLTISLIVGGITLAF
jgi:hypothetical protein